MPSPIVDEPGSPTGVLNVRVLVDTSDSVFPPTSLMALLKAWRAAATSTAAEKTGEVGVQLDIKPILLPDDRDGKDTNSAGSTPTPHWRPIEQWISAPSVDRYSPGDSPVILVFVTDGLRSTSTEKNACAAKNRLAITNAVKALPPRASILFLVGIHGYQCPGEPMSKGLLCNKHPRCDFFAARSTSEAASFDKELKEKFAAMAAGALHQSVLHITTPDPFFDDVVLVGRDGQFGCSGVAVGQRAVLTAGHCLPATLVHTGEGSGQQGRTLAVIEATHHPDPQEDIALLRLGEPLQVSVKPRRRAKDHDAPSALLRYVGFGAVDPRGPAERICRVGSDPARQPDPRGDARHQQRIPILVSIRARRPRAGSQR